MHPAALPCPAMRLPMATVILLAATACGDDDDDGGSDAGALVDAAADTGPVDPAADHIAGPDEAEIIHTMTVEHWRSSRWAHPARE